MTQYEFKHSIWKGRFASLTGCDPKDIEISKSIVGGTPTDTIISPNDIANPYDSNLAYPYVAVNYIAIACTPMLAAFLFTANKYSSFDEQIYSNRDMYKIFRLGNYATNTGLMHPIYTSAVRYIVPSYRHVYFILFFGIEVMNSGPGSLIGNVGSALFSRYGVYASFSGLVGKCLTDASNCTLNEDSHTIISNPVNIDNGKVESNLLTGLVNNDGNDKDIEKVLAFLVHQEVTPLIGCEKSGTEAILNGDVDIPEFRKIYYQGHKYIDEKDVQYEK